MRTLVYSLLILLFLSYGHESNAQDAQKLDSYNDQIQSSEAEQWHLEDFLTALGKEQSARAYIIAYAGREDNPGKAWRYALRAKNYMVKLRGIDPQRIVAVDGGRREEFIVELWLVPDKANPPAATPTINVPDDLRDNLLYDEFDLGYDNFGSRNQDDAARLDGFAAALKRESRSWGCIVAYAASGDDRMGLEWDQPGTALKIARSERSYLTRKQGLTPSRLSVVDGGYSGRTVQLWIMRQDARFDNGPFLYPSRLKVGRSSTLTIKNNETLDLCCKVCNRGHTDPYILKHGENVKP